MGRKTSVAAAAAVQTAPAGGGDAVPDYDAADVLVVNRPDQLKALGDDLRSRIVVLLRTRARSVTELAERLQLPKGTVAHHVKVLEAAGLLRVVRTRKVRAVTERYYGRTARLFLFESQDERGAEDVRNIVAASLRIAADEILPLNYEDPQAIGCSGTLRVRLSPEDAVRFNRRLDKLMTEFRAAEDPDGVPYGLAIAMYRRSLDADS
ncbi:MAG: winged helix-turn-helix domain-containing protein [Actinomycetota bacterium]